MRELKFEITGIAAEQLRKRPEPPKSTAWIYALFVASAIWIASGSRTTPTPIALALSPAVMDFGTQAIGGQTPSIRTLLVGNMGNNPIPVGALRIQGANGTAFIRSSTGCTEQILAASSVCEIAIQFSPKQTGRQEARIELLDNGKNVVASSRLLGMATKVDTPSPTQPPALEVPAELSFDPAPPGGQTQRRLTLSNTGGQQLDVSIMRLADNQTFKLNQDFEPVHIPPNGSFNVDLNFSPLLPGTYQSNLVITSNSTPETAIVALSGTATPPPTPRPELTLDPAQFSKPGESATATLWNRGGGTLIPDRPAIKGAQAKWFKIQSNLCGKRPLRTDESCQITVTLIPQAERVFPQLMGVQGTNLMIPVNMPDERPTVALTIKAPAKPPGKPRPGITDYKLPVNPP